MTVYVFKNIQSIQCAKIKIRISPQHLKIKPFDIETDDKLKFFEICDQA